MDRPVLIIDADPVVYRSAFAAQNTTHHYVYKTKAGKLKHGIWNDGNKARRFFKRYPGLEILDHHAVVEPESVDHARQCAATVLKDIVKKATEYFGQEPEIEAYLSGPGNFRYDIATIKGYKSGRKQELPVHYQAVRDYIHEKWGAKIVEGWEADDEVSIRTREVAPRPWLLATIDKDLDQVPGPHYDYRQHVFYNVYKEDAELFFWEQVIGGDSTDSIPGCYRLRKPRELVDKWAEEATDPEWMWQNAVDTYQAVMAKYEDKYPEGMTPEEAALETARLVHMMEYRGQLWTPPGKPDEEIKGWKSSSSTG